MLYENSNGLEYKEGEKNKIDKNSKEILEPILNFRKELDKWNTFTPEKISGLRKEVILYLRNTFGVESYEPREGDVFDVKNKNIKATKIEETKNQFLDSKIKKVFSPGYKINDSLFEYYEKWYANKELKMRKKWKSLQNTIPEQKLDKVMEEDKAWLKKYSFPKSIKPAQVEIYRYKV